MPAYVLTQRHRLQADGLTLFDAVSPALSLHPDPTETGVFVQAQPETSAAELSFALGQWRHVEQFTSAYRPNPWWMLPNIGTDVRDVLPETQYLLCELPWATYCLILPLVDETFRSSLCGTPDNCMTIKCESGSSDSTADKIKCLFLAIGDDPYRLMADAADAVCRELRTCRRRRDKPLPVVTDCLGWCTWDAFYHRVSHDQVLAGLRSFADGGILPRFMILDDGWLSVKESEDGGRRLTSFTANERFPGGLRRLIKEAKQSHGVESFYVWHALQGYWDGVDPDHFASYDTVTVPRTYSQGILHHSPHLCETDDCTIIKPSHIRQFFNDFHEYLKEQGVDGVKVDNQSTMEALAETQGGRVALIKSYGEALEESAAEHFGSELINCMSCSNDSIYNSRTRSLTRSSTDFQPRNPESHGPHVATNALTTYFLGEFVHPDWDMFQSGHKAGAFHAAARSISGGPIYVSDEPGRQDFDILRKLVLSNGQVLRSKQPARPTRDCLFTDPCRDDVLLKVFNRNRFGGVVGAFNCRFHEDEKKRHFIAGGVRPADVEGIEGDNFALYSHRGRNLTHGKRESRIAAWLTELGFEIITIMPIQQGFAPIGLTDKYNSAAAIQQLSYADRCCSLKLLDGGTFLAWAEFEPLDVQVDGHSVGFSYHPREHALQVKLPVGTAPCLDIRLRVGPKKKKMHQPEESALTHLVGDSSRRLLFRIPQNEEGS